MKRGGFGRFGFYYDPEGTIWSEARLRWELFLYSVCQRVFRGHRWGPVKRDPILGMWGKTCRRCKVMAIVDPVSTSGTTASNTHITIRGGFYGS